MEFVNFLVNENDHTFRSKNHILQDIFKDWWEPFCQEYKNIRPVVYEEVEKFMGCGSKNNGYSVYECEDCGNYMFVPFTCKSRFCPSCGVNSCIRVANEMPTRCLDVKHRHITFTISDELCSFFQKDRSLLDILFKAASNTILSWFKDKNKAEHFVPGIIATLHTFGRDLKWNTHIHMLVTEGAMGNITEWKSCDFFSFDMLRKRFMTTLLSMLSKVIFSQKFKKLKNDLYKRYDNGFYVHAPKSQFSNVQGAIKYITRYTNRPAMAESRIINYDPNIPSVTYYYDRHEDGKRVTETVHPFELIKKLIIHIPEKGFNMTRYYGIYAMKKQKSRHLKRIKEKLTKPLKWADKLFKFFNKNPLICSCGNKLKYQYFVESSSHKFFQLLNPRLS